MITIEADDLRDNFTGICDLIINGETVIVYRPHNQNVVVLSEKEYNDREKALRNAEYLMKIDDSLKELEQGKSVTLTIGELEQMESMTGDEAKRYFAEVKKGQGKKE